MSLIGLNEFKEHMKKMKSLYLFFVAAFSCTIAFTVNAEGSSEEHQGKPAVVGDAALGQGLSAVCGACHGADGNSILVENPKLAGQGADYLHKQLRQFKNGERQNAVMGAQVAALSDADLLNLSAYFSEQSIKYDTAENDDSLVIAERIYRAGDLDRNIAACAACHGPAGRGNSAAKFPALAGQHKQYTAAQLRAFRAVARGDDASVTRSNDPEGMMRDTVKELTDAEIDALANYIQGLQL